MENRSVTHSTYVIERSYPAPPERVFKAFSDPDIKERWFADRGPDKDRNFVTDFRVGGAERLTYRTPADSPLRGASLTNDTTYKDIVPGRRIVFAYTMAVGDNRISSSQVTIEISPTPEGTHLIFTEQGAYFENSDGPQMRQGGWNKLLDSLAQELSR